MMTRKHQEVNPATVKASSFVSCLFSVVFVLQSSIQPLSALQPSTPSHVFASNVALLTANTSRNHHHEKNVLASRRRVIKQTLWTSLTAILFGEVVKSRPAHAAYGASASMELPNYIDYLIEKNRAGVVDNPDEILYKGADPSRQLERLRQATNQLTVIPSLAAEKKWSQVSGVITGPLGELVANMREVRASSATGRASNEELVKATKQLQADLYVISAAASRKSVEGCNQGAAAALKDLENFITIAF